MKIILLGPPGSGKGTVSEFLVKEYHLTHISPGELLREEVKRQTPIGKAIQKYIEKGDLVPTHIVSDMIKLEVEGDNNYILDGYPRSLDQTLDTKDLNIDLVIYLDIDLNTVIKRLAGRRMDPKTGKIYHLQFNPAPKEIQKRLIQRTDDHADVIKERFKVFRKETSPVVSYFKKQKSFVAVDASQTPQKLFTQIKKIIKEHQPKSKPKKAKAHH